MNKVARICLALLAGWTTASPVQPYSATSGFGPNPILPEPETDLIPTVRIARAVGWDDGESPQAASGFEVRAFRRGLDHPRWLYVLPNGDVLVAETNAPAGREDRRGVRGWFMRRAMKRAGAAAPSADRISLLRDADGDGVAEVISGLIRELKSPFGMALVGEELYVAATDRLWRFPYHEGDTVIEAVGTAVAELPAGPINRHWTKNVVASPDGTRLYITVGSNSNVAEFGIEEEVHRAAILEFDRVSGALRVFASGLRNANGMDWQPQTGRLWTVVNERDELGDDLVPDFLTSVRDGGFYGWPWSYFGKHVDERVEPQEPELVARAIAPDYALGAHTASLGLVFYEGSLFPARFSHGAFIGQHGSWNRENPSGYKVIFVPFDSGVPSGMPEDILSGFLDDDGNARGRPVGVAIDKAGALLIADDVGNTIWRVTPVAASHPETASR